MRPVVLAFVVVIVSSYSLDDPLADHQSYAIMMMDQHGDYAAGIASFRAALRFGPSESMNWGNLGIALQNNKNPARRGDPNVWLETLRDAQRHLSKALELNPRNHFAKRNLHRNKDLREAAELAATVEKDYYAILGIDADASEQEVKKAFRELSRRLHPDKQRSTTLSRAEATRRFDECREAFEVLSKPGKRALYDTMGTKGVREWEKTEGQKDRWGKQVESSLRQERPLELRVNVPLGVLYTGGEVARTVRRTRVCRGCKEEARDNKRCRSCQRCPAQVQWIRERTRDGRIMQRQERLPSKEYCRTEEKTLTALIGKGMSTAAPHNRVVFQFAGDQKPGMAPADVIFNIALEASPFQRQGDDLKFEQKVTLKEALLGFSKSIAHLDGHTLKISSAGITRPGIVRVIDGEGMPRTNAPDEYGKLYVNYKIKFPAAVGPDSRAVLAGLADDVAQW